MATENKNPLRVFIQFPQNNLCYEDGTAKIYVLRLSNNDGADTAFIDVYDLEDLLMGLKWIIKIKIKSL